MCGWVGGWVRRYFLNNSGGLELVLEGGGVLSKFLLDNSSFSAPLLIIIEQSLK